MALEIERKFLVRGDAWRAAEGTCYCQGYLNRDKERTVRVRIAGDKAFLTVKGPNTGATRWEVDEFLGENHGLVVAEIELPSPEQPFDHPDWVGEEVTDDPRYRNSNLSTHPYNTWRIGA